MVDAGYAAEVFLPGNKIVLPLSKPLKKIQPQGHASTGAQFVSILLICDGNIQDTESLIKP